MANSEQAVTRIIACMIALPMTIMNFSGLIGGFLAETWMSNVSLRLYFHQAFAGIGFIGCSCAMDRSLKRVVIGACSGD